MSGIQGPTGQGSNTSIDPNAGASSSNTAKVGSNLAGGVTVNGVRGSSDDPEYNLTINDPTSGQAIGVGWVKVSDLAGVMMNLMSSIQNMMNGIYRPSLDAQNAKLEVITQIQNFLSAAGGTSDTSDTTNTELIDLANGNPNMVFTSDDGKYSISLGQFLKDNDLLDQLVTAPITAFTIGLVADPSYQTWANETNGPKQQGGGANPANFAQYRLGTGNSKGYYADIGWSYAALQADGSALLDSDGNEVTYSGTSLLTGADGFALQTKDSSGNYAVYTTAMTTSQYQNLTTAVGNEYQQQNTKISNDTSDLSTITSALQSVTQIAESIMKSLSPSQIGTAQNVGN